jgi:two-component system, LytTR family, response regulator
VRALIVDDERSARRRLARLLGEEGGVEVVGEAADGVEAADVARRLRPDVAFLDVRMPEADGFEALRLMGVDRPPAVVFVTAFDQYAIEAFDACALDYLLKPVERARLARTLDRVRSQLAPEASSDVERRLARLEALVVSRLRPAPVRVHAERRGLVVPLDVDEVDAFVAEDRLVFAVLERERLLVNETLSELEARLAERRFARVHRGALVNLDRVATIEAHAYGGLKLKMRGGLDVEVSRRQAATVRAALGL